MTPIEFMTRYTEYFGEEAPLPIAVVYSDKPMGEMKTMPGCMFKQLHRANNGETVTLDASSLTCGGGKLYAGLGSTPDIKPWKKLINISATVKTHGGIFFALAKR